MALNVSRQGWLGVKAETSFGAGGNPTDYLPWITNTLDGVNKPIENVASYAMRNKVYSAVVGTQWGQGDVELNLDPSLSGYFYAAALGSTSSATVSGAVKNHTHSVNQSATPYSLSLINDRVADRQLYTGATVNTLETNVSNGLATVKASILSKFPSTTTSGTAAPALGTIFTWANYTYQFGSTYSAASSASATPLTEFTFTINNNTDVVYESGLNGASRIGQKDFELTGKATLFFEGTTDRSTFYATGNNSMIVTFLGAGTGTTQEKLQFNFYGAYFDTFDVSTGLDDFFVEDISFVGDYNPTNSKTFDMTQVNSNSSY